jgi:magnesium-transporting ATPase (P-type)
MFIIPSILSSTAAGANVRIDDSAGDLLPTDPLADTSTCWLTNRTFLVASIAIVVASFLPGSPDFSKRKVYIGTVVMNLLATGFGISAIVSEFKSDTCSGPLETLQRILTITATVESIISVLVAMVTRKHPKEEEVDNFSWFVFAFLNLILGIAYCIVVPIYVNNAGVTRLLSDSASWLRVFVMILISVAIAACCFVVMFIVEMSRGDISNGIRYFSSSFPLVKASLFLTILACVNTKWTAVSIAAIALLARKGTLLLGSIGNSWYYVSIRLLSNLRSRAWRVARSTLTVIVNT